MPNNATYRQALRLFDDPAQYPIFPFYTANQVDKAAVGAPAATTSPPSTRPSSSG